MSNKYVTIGNIEYSKTCCDGNMREEICFIYPNPHYQQEEKLMQDGWVFDENGVASKDCVHIDPSCFKNPTSKYVIATVRWNSCGDEWDLITVGDRPWKLSPKDQEDFVKVLDHINVIADRGLGLFNIDYFEDN